MWRSFLSLVFVVSCAVAAAGQEAEKSADPAAALFADVKKNPDDVAALRAYINAAMTGIARTMNSDPEGALKAADQLAENAKTLAPETPAGKALVSNMKDLAGAYRNHIRAMQSPYGDLVKQLTEVARLVNTEPKEAEEKVTALKKAIETAAATDAGKEHKEVLDYLATSISQVERPLAASRKLTEMIGKPAAPLKVEAWVNGSPLTDKDLEGKVVLLDFWAVWCGPCIATFPHLREWNEQYAEKGLVIIGLTGYYNFKWDEDAGKAVRSEGEVPKDEERQMLAKFAKSHDLGHRFAITADDSMAEYYGVSGIPHVVVIDREGKVRMMKVGSGEENARAIGELLEKLIASK